MAGSLKRKASPDQGGAHQAKCLEKLKASFLEAVRSIPEVRLVLVEHGLGAFPRIWTVIAAAPFADDVPRRRVYEAEGAASRLAGGPTVDFRLINANELKGPLPNFLPSNADVIFQR